MFEGYATFENILPIYPYNLKDIDVVIQAFCSIVESSPDRSTFAWTFVYMHF